MTLLKRIVVEKRRLVVPLAAALIINAAFYGLAVYPLSVRVARAADRAEMAASARQAANRAHGEARAVQTSKERTDAELRRFYREILPPDLAGARRLTYARLAGLAEEFKLRYERRSVTTEQPPDTPLARVHMTMVLGGEYDDIRRFLYRLETAPEFVVIEDVSLARAVDRDAPLVLTLEVSTYYWTGGDGT